MLLSRRLFISLLALPAALLQAPSGYCQGSRLPSIGEVRKELLSKHDANEDGWLDVSDPFHHEGVAGGTFEARIEAVTDRGIIPSVKGSSHRHATTTFSLDPHDPVGLGFLFR